MDGLSSVSWVRLNTAAGAVLTLTSTEEMPLKLVVQQHEDNMAWARPPRVLALPPEFEVSLAMLYPIGAFKPVRLQQAAAEVRQLVYGDDLDTEPELMLEAVAVLGDSRPCTLTAPRLYPTSTEPSGEPAGPGMWATQLLQADMGRGADGHAFRLAATAAS